MSPRAHGSSDPMTARPGARLDRRPIHDRRLGIRWRLLAGGTPHAPAGTGRPAAPAQPGRRVQLRARRPRGRPPGRRGGVRRARRPGVQAARAVAHLLERRRHPARILEIISPAGFEGYFRELVEMLHHGAPTGPQRAALASRYGLDVDPRSIPPSPPNTASSSAPRPPPQQRSALQHDGRSQQLRVPSVGQVPGRVFAAMRCTWTRRSGPLPRVLDRSGTDENLFVIPAIVQLAVSASAAPTCRSSWATFRRTTTSLASRRLGTTRSERHLYCTHSRRAESNCAASSMNWSCSPRPSYQPVG